MAKSSLPPGFRFHPNDDELVMGYLKRKVLGKPFRFEAINEIDLYRYSPQDLPELSRLRSRDLQWFFFSAPDRKYPNGRKTKRSTDRGFWKTTGKDREITYKGRTVGTKKSLVYHEGRPPSGLRTNWIMYEYKLEKNELAGANVAHDSFVLCKIFQKSGFGPRIGEQYGGSFDEAEWEEDMDDVALTGDAGPSVISTASQMVSSPLPFGASLYNGPPDAPMCNVHFGEVVLQDDAGGSNVTWYAGPRPPFVTSDSDRPSSFLDPYAPPGPATIDKSRMEDLAKFLMESPPPISDTNNEFNNCTAAQFNGTETSSLQAYYKELEDEIYHCGGQGNNGYNYVVTEELAGGDYVELNDILHTVPDAAAESAQFTVEPCPLTSESYLVQEIRGAAAPQGNNGYIYAVTDEELAGGDYFEPSDFLPWDAVTESAQFTVDPCPSISESYLVREIRGAAARCDWQPTK